MALLVVLLVTATMVPWVVPGLTGLLDWSSNGGSHASAGGPPGGAVDPPELSTSPVTPPRPAPGTVGTRTRLRSFGAPLEVRLPRLGVAAEVVPASTTPQGVLVPPADPRTLGWWRAGRSAGSAVGATVVTGHTVHTGGGALDRLDALSEGDRARVRTEAGWIDYRVVESRVLPKAGFGRHAADLFGRDGRPRLVLVTCSGWDGARYLSNTVVTAVAVAEHPFGR